MKRLFNYVKHFENYSYELGKIYDKNIKLITELYNDCNKTAVSLKKYVARYDSYIDRLERENSLLRDTFDLDNLVEKEKYIEMKDANLVLSEMLKESNEKLEKIKDKITLRNFIKLLSPEIYSQTDSISVKQKDKLIEIDKDKCLEEYLDYYVYYYDVGLTYNELNYVVIIIEKGDE